MSSNSNVPYKLMLMVIFCELLLWYVGSTVAENMS